MVEILVHRAGYIFGHEQIATHQRMRYHIIDRDQNLPHVDPAFWLVHYGPAEADNRRPVGHLPINPQIQKLMQERVFLEQQGAVLQRKEFMLMDRSNWPTVNTNIGVQPRQMHPAYQQQPGMPRPQIPPGYPQQPIAQPPSKRVKVDRSGAAQVMAQKDQISDAIFEEDTEFGDYFDTLTPAEISKMRYKQHHEWMEEIFSSVYSMSQIVPEDLGFGLTGSLKELTDDILTTPDPLAVVAPFDSAKDGREDKGVAVRSQEGTNTYTKLSPEKLDEFERRIAQFVEKGKADIQAMKQQHAETVASFNKSKTYMKAERKLRDVDGGDSDAIVHEVESNLHAKIAEQKTKVCIEEGGLEKEDKTRLPPANGTQQTQETASSSSNGGGFGGNGNGNGNGNGMFETGDNSAANLLDEFGGGSYTNSPAARISTPGISQPHSGVPTPGATAGGPDNSGFSMQQGADAANEDQQQAAGDDNGLDLLEGMDMDVDMTGLGENVGGEGEHEGSETKPGAEDDWVMVGEGNGNGQAAQSTANPTPPSAAAATSTTQPTQPPPSTNQQGPPTSAEQSSASSTAQAITSTMVEAPTSQTDTPTGNEHEHGHHETEAGGGGESMFDNADIFEGLEYDGDGGDDLGLDIGGGEFEGAFGDGSAGHGGA